MAEDRKMYCENANGREVCYDIMNCPYQKVGKNLCFERNGHRYTISGIHKEKIESTSLTWWGELSRSGHQEYVQVGDGGDAKGWRQRLVNSAWHMLSNADTYNRVHGSPLSAVTGELRLSWSANDL